MSILTSFKKLVDPETARIDEVELKRDREQPKREADGDGPDHRCHVCGLVSNERSYCPSCLAETMRPIKKK